MMRSHRYLLLGVVLAASVLLAPAVWAQKKGTLLKNSTIISMVKGGMPESLILSTIQSSEPQFDLSEKGIAQLKAAGVSQKVIDAMGAAEARKSSAAPAPARAGPRTAAPVGTAAVPREPPFVLWVKESGKQNLPAEKAKIATTKAKSQDLNLLAAEGLIGQALQGVATEATAEASERAGAASGTGYGQTAGGIVGGLLKARKPSVTFVWGVPGRSSPTALATNAPKFEVVYEGMAGVKAEEFAPVLLRVVPAKDEWRLVGATKGKEDALQSYKADWELYGGYVEERIPVRVNQTAPGRAEVEPELPLVPGEYALVLRPLAKKKKYAGAAVATGAGDAALVNLVWGFSVRAAR